MIFSTFAKTITLALIGTAVASPLSLSKRDDDPIGIRVMSNKEADYIKGNEGKLNYDPALAVDGGVQIGGDGVYISQEVGGWPLKNPATQKIAVIKTSKDIKDDDYQKVNIPYKYKKSDDEDHELWDNGEDIIKDYMKKVDDDLKDDEAIRISYISNRGTFLQALIPKKTADKLDLTAEIFDTTEELEKKYPNLKVDWEKWEGIKGKLVPE